MIIRQLKGGDKIELMSSLIKEAIQRLIRSGKGEAEIQVAVKTQGRMANKSGSPVKFSDSDSKSVIDLGGVKKEVDKGLPKGITVTVQAKQILNESTGEAKFIPGKSEREDKIVDLETFQRQYPDSSSDSLISALSKDYMRQREEKIREEQSQKRWR